MSRCDGCGGEDCACCEVFIEEQMDQRYARMYEDDDFNPLIDGDHPIYGDDEDEMLTDDDDEDGIRVFH